MPSPTQLCQKIHFNIPTVCRNVLYNVQNIFLWLGCCSTSKHWVCSESCTVGNILEYKSEFVWSEAQSDLHGGRVTTSFTQIKDAAANERATRQRHERLSGRERRTGASKGGRKTLKKRENLTTATDIKIRKTLQTYRESTQCGRHTGSWRPGAAGWFHFVIKERLRQNFLYCTVRNIKIWDIWIIYILGLSLHLLDPLKRPHLCDENSQCINCEINDWVIKSVCCCFLLSLVWPFNDTQLSYGDNVS